MELIDFNSTIEFLGGVGKAHLLLGNGFSIACRPNIFVYEKLLEQADFSELPKARSVFEKLGTADFERVIFGLVQSKKIFEIYGEKDSCNFLNELTSDAVKLRDLLVKTLAKTHPESPLEIEEHEYYACGKFLNNFKSIYTLNYDLLLYWAILHLMEYANEQFDDGFRKPEENGAADYVVWHSNKSNSGRKVVYLHGALHLFDRGTEIEKFTWTHTGIKLIDQIRGALQEDRFPVFVSEGTSENKLEKILHNPYLAKAYRSLESISGSLLVYGHSFSENDEHYLRLIEKGGIRKLAVGIYGDPERFENKAKIQRVNRMVESRSAIKKLDVVFFDSSTANIWGDEATKKEWESLKVEKFKNLLGVSANAK